MIYTFLLFELLIIWTTAFYKAPGTIMLKIGIPELIDSCFTEECEYNFEFCIGSGRSLNDQCLLMPRRNLSGYFSVNPKPLMQESFKTDNIRSSFYINANFTFRTSNKDIETLTFKDSLVHYAAHSGPHRLSIHSATFISMTIEIHVRCESGYYPPFQCTKMCFGIPSQYHCDMNGTMVCYKGYVLLLNAEKCVKDICKDNKSLCQNNSTCVNDVNTIRCICKKYYSGNTCEIWDPCQEHQCKNLGICIRNEIAKDYLCQCTDNYYGKYCENIEDPCKGKHCPINTFCQHNYYEAICIKSTKPWPIGDPKRRLPILDYIPSTVKSNMLLTTRLENSDIRSRETLIQQPVQRDFTIIAIIIFLLLFIICCFGIMFWIQLYKFFQRRIKSNTNPIISHMPSVINRQKHKISDYNIQKWCSMDEGAFSLWRISQNEFSTLTFISGTNALTKQNDSKDASLYKFKDFQSTFKSKKSETNHQNNSVSNNIKSNPCDTSEERLEKMEDNDENCLIVDDFDSEYQGVSFV